MKVFLDVDGVLADFLGAALRVHGRTVDPWPAGEWDAYKVLGMTPEAFWDPLGSAEFWAGLEKTADHADILSLVEKRFGQENICLLTSPPLDPDSLAGKARWIKEHMPQYARRFLIGPAKHFCAGYQSLLIDDSDANVEGFRAGGGHAILLPRPWNSEWEHARTKYCNGSVTFLSGATETASKYLRRAGATAPKV